MDKNGKCEWKKDTLFSPCSKMLEEMDQRIKTGIDWGRIKDIEESLM